MADVLHAYIMAYTCPIVLSACPRGRKNLRRKVQRRIQGIQKQGSDVHTSLMEKE
jgi:hypothetical protein